MLGQLTRRIVMQSVRGSRAIVAETFRERGIRPTNFQKKVLVWSKAYNNVSEVPEFVSASKMRKSLDVFRGKMTLGFSAAGLVVMFVAVSFIEGDRSRSNANK
jgi:hypothetical protein